MLSLAVIGMGNRARKYLSYLGDHPGAFRVGAIVEPSEVHREAARKQYGLPVEACFSSAEAFFAERRSVDAVLITSPDRSHFPQAMKAASYAYHILLEKPSCESDAEFTALLDAVGRAGVVACGCYVLRYHPLYRRLKSLLDEGRIGRLKSVSHRVAIGRDRMCHSFVRGPWGSSRETSPIFLSKCCHDVDILLWMTGARLSDPVSTPFAGAVAGSPAAFGVPAGAVAGSPAAFGAPAGAVAGSPAGFGAPAGTPGGVPFSPSVSSEGGLTFFRPEKAPQGAAERCTDCPLQASCPWSATDLYLRRGLWTDSFFPLPGETKEEAVLREVRTGRYGRCVFRSGNDVADWQRVCFSACDGVSDLIRFDIEMDGLSPDEGRRTILTGSRGRILSDGSVITVETLPEGPSERIDLSAEVSRPFHAGADFLLMEDFLRAVREPSHTPLTTLSSTRDSLLVCFAASLSL